MTLRIDCIMKEALRHKQGNIVEIPRGLAINIENMRIATIEVEPHGLVVHETEFQTSIKFDGNWTTACGHFIGIVFDNKQFALNYFMDKFQILAVNFPLKRKEATERFVDINLQYQREQTLPLLRDSLVGHHLYPSLNDPSSLIIYNDFDDSELLRIWVYGHSLFVSEGGNEIILQPKEEVRNIDVNGIQIEFNPTFSMARIIVTLRRYKKIFRINIYNNKLVLQRELPEEDVE